jgi:DNA polymerase-3 subunit alpha
MNVREVYGIGEARSHYAKALVLVAKPHHFVAGLADTLNDLLEKNQSVGCPVVIDYSSDAASAKLMLGNGRRLAPDDDVMLTLRQMLGKENVFLNYSR